MRDFDDLVPRLEAERPVIDPAFARSLDQRAADGFARPPRRFRLPAPAWLGLPAAAVATLAVVVAVLGGASTPDRSNGEATSSAARDTTATAPLEAAGGSAAAGVVPPAAAKALSGRVQEQTAGLTLVAPGKDLPALGDRVIAVADGVGGFVVSSSVGTSTGGAYALRVPVARLGDALARLSRLGHVSERTQGSQDITAQRNGARDRYDEAVAERRSLLSRMARATTDNEVASLRARLRDVNARMSAARAALARVLRRARFASVSVTLQARQGVVAPPDDGRWTPGDALRDAGRVLEVAAGAILVAGAVLVPLGLLAVLGALAARATGRRGRARVLESV